MDVCKRDATLGKQHFYIKISERGVLRIACVFSGDYKHKVSPHSGILGQLRARPEQEHECYTHKRNDGITPSVRSNTAKNCIEGSPMGMEKSWMTVNMIIEHYLPRDERW